MILVTGGAGFIGSNVCTALSERGIRVAVADKLRHQLKWRNLAGVELADFVAPETLAPWLDAHIQSLEAIIHLGAISSTTETNADLIIEINFRLSWFLWNWCAHHGKRFIYASSAATYGAGEQGFDDDVSTDALAKLRPRNCYGWSKHVFDRRIARAIVCHEPRPPQWVGLKFFNVYGPNEHHKGAMQSVVAQQYAAVVGGSVMTLFKSHRPDVLDGEQKRDFVYVDDCVAVILWLLETPTVSGLYNIGTGVARSFADLAHALFAALRRHPGISYIEMPESLRANYQYFTCASIERLRRAGFVRHFTNLEDGVRTYVERYLSKPHGLR